MFEAIGAGLLSLLTVQAMLFLTIGVVYGIVVGILPGLGGIVAMALLLPFTYGFEPAAASRVALAYSRSVAGAQTGQVYRVW